jgi:hypothetical protein
MIFWHLMLFFNKCDSLELTSHKEILATLTNKFQSSTFSSLEDLSCIKECTSPDYATK